MKRAILAVGLLAARLAHAGGGDDLHLAEVELRMGAGVAAIGWRRNEVSLGVAADHAVIAEPWLSVYGELMLDRLEDPTIGASAGIQLRPLSPVRLSAGGLAFFGPERIYGGRASVGACKAVSALSFCGDLELDVYVDQAREPADRVAADVRIVFGLAFPLL